MGPSSNERTMRRLYPSVVKLEPTGILRTANPQVSKTIESFLSAKGDSFQARHDQHVGTFGSPEDGILLRILERSDRSTYRLYALFCDHQPAKTLEVKIVETNGDERFIPLDSSGIGEFSSEHSVDWASVTVALIRR